MKYLPWKDEAIVAFLAFLALVLWACGASGCGTFTRQSVQSGLVQSGLDCLRLTLERALADCSGSSLEDTCKARVRSEHASECEHFPELCAETVVSGP